MPVGDGVFEMRALFGPGWRMDDVHRGKVVIVTLGGGRDKRTQQAGIDAAQALASSVEG